MLARKNAMRSHSLQRNPPLTVLITFVRNSLSQLLRGALQSNMLHAQQRSYPHSPLCLLIIVLVLLLKTVVLDVFLHRTQLNLPLSALAHRNSFDKPSISSCIWLILYQILNLKTGFESTLDDNAGFVQFIAIIVPLINTSHEWIRSFSHSHFHPT